MRTRLAGFVFVLVFIMAMTYSGFMVWAQETTGQTAELPPTFTATATPTSTPPPRPPSAGGGGSMPKTCANTAAIPDPESTLLIWDCGTLLNAKDTLRGSSSLNWSTTRPISEWVGVTVSSSRVTALHLYALNGKLPPELGDLSGLIVMQLNAALTGSIPPYLGNLANLQTLNLADNQLTGTIPASLVNLTNLRTLSLYSNTLTGNIPPALGNFAHLEVLDLRDNQLSSTIPGQLDWLSDTLQTLNLGGNALTGCVGSGLWEISGDIQTIGLSECLDVSAATSTPTATPTPRPPISTGGCGSSGPTNTPTIRPPSSAGGGGGGGGGGLVPVPTNTPTHTATPTATPTPTCTPTAMPTHTATPPRNRPSGGGGGGSMPKSTPTPTTTATPDPSKCENTRAIPRSRGHGSDHYFTNRLINDCEILLNVKDVLRGTASLNWSNAIPFEEWDGVSIKYSRLRKLNLQRKGLTGSIPAELGDLFILTELDLSHNQLTGTIPANLGSLATLQNLYLNNNRLIGPIPVEVLTSGFNRNVFRIHGNPGIPCIPLRNSWRIYLLQGLTVCPTYAYADKHVHFDPDTDGHTDSNAHSNGRTHLLGRPDRYC